MEQEDRLVHKYTIGGISERIYDRLVEELKVEYSKLKEELNNINQKINVYKQGETQYREVLNYLSKMDKLRHITDDETKRKYVLNFIERVEVEYMEEKKEHIAEIQFKIPLNGRSNIQLMGNGTDLDTGDNVIENMDLLSIPTNVITQQL